MKLKKMPLSEFQAVMTREWTPVKLVGDALPSWASGIPESVLATALASGTCNVDQSKLYHSEQIPAGQLIGGFDIYGHAPDDPVPFNKDWYAVVKGPDDSTVLLIDGPQKDAEHWLFSIAEPCGLVEVLGVPRRLPQATKRSN
jgi:hypothetical protein